MTNKEIAGWFRRLADMMELHGENPFKIRSYQQAYVTLRKWTDPLSDLTLEELAEIPGIGKAISEKIRELAETGDLATYRKYANQTPEGVIDLLAIPGVGPKKVRTLWKDLGVESVGELLYACHENRLIELNGFGLKKQADLKNKLEFYMLTKGQLRYPEALQVADRVKALLQVADPGSRIEETGELRRKCPVIKNISLLWCPQEKATLSAEEGWTFVEKTPAHWIWQEEENPLVTVWITTVEGWGQRLWETTGSSAYVSSFQQWTNPLAPEEGTFMQLANLPDHIPEWRESVDWAQAAAKREGDLITTSAIRGVIHAHSTWSDGIHSLEEMAFTAKESGFAYLVITDHSQSAFYANGLKPDRVKAQRAEIATLNSRLAPFRIFHGIESDILYTGALDYDQDVLDGFDLIIASIHSQLKMDLPKAMERLLAAIEHPNTRILGHPTGRLLLSREGYPVDHKKMIEACARHQVVVELNANPQRLDLDYTWIPYAIDCGVKIAINPDAHSTGGIRDISYGVQVARKAGLGVGNCLNTMSLKEFEDWLFV
ncbi:MAG: PHP domain-containing protein [Saprospiraceae bacterium]|nr:PHP domain-containing protein [Saprospiraceae bacterium]